MGGPAEMEELPQANVKRIVKAKLTELARAYSDDDAWKDVPVNKEALLAFSESAKIFIHYLSATANTRIIGDIRSKFAEYNGQEGGLSSFLHKDFPKCASRRGDKQFQQTEIQEQSLTNGRGRANDICRESRRQTIYADDVLKALEEIEFQEFVEPLKAYLEELRKENVSKKSESKKKAASSKRKIEEKGDDVENTIPNGQISGSLIADDEDKMDEDGMEENSSE